MRLEKDESRRKSEMVSCVRQVYQSLREAEDEGTVTDWVDTAMNDPGAFLVTRDLMDRYIGCRIEYSDDPYTYLDTREREIVSDDLGRVRMDLTAQAATAIDDAVRELLGE